LILIVDDNTGMRQTVKAMLLELDQAFCECDDGSEALEIYRRFRPDWVLMDARMAGVDGITATRSITATFPMARVVMISGHNDPMLKQQAQEAGAMAYVLKDDLSQLLTIIGTVEGRKG
jgi:CheY-like chemotaxis protein